jgi:hypothetical protein
MALKIKNQNLNQNLEDKVVYSYNCSRHALPHLPPGTYQHFLPQNFYISFTPIRVPAPKPVEMPETSLPRAINYYADYGGCGFWRMIWPEISMNAYVKGTISGLTSMVLDMRFYQGIKAIRFQRQATPIQNSFIKELRKHQKDLGYRLIYEVDDIVFREDIPDYNRCKDAFASKETETTILDIMSQMDEITVTCQFMKDYYISKTGNKNITVIPNYAPKSWLSRYYNPERLVKLYDQYKKRPRILYAGSGTHVDVINRTGMKDDFEHVLPEIIKARKKFKFVWKGTFPPAIKPFIDNGEMEFLPWSPLFEHPQGMLDAKCNACFASLQDNIFNRSKSNIKIVEAGGLGMPGAFQDMCTYQEADVKFKSGKDLINQLEYIMSDCDRYMQLSSNINKFTNTLWLEDHLDEYEALYFTAYGSKERNLKSPRLISLNKEQRI